jgi:2,4-dienoyl-CoA reductase-like NADH-dependent reductase (Old Yellow Enzyme family)
LSARSFEAAFEPMSLGPARLRSRFVKAATFEGMTPGGVPTPALARFHARLAAGGLAMTTVAYGAVSAGARTFGGQLRLDADTRAPLRALTDAVHAAGACASLQLTHCGFFSKLRRPDGSAPRGPSWSFNAYGAAAGLPVAPPLEREELRDVVAAFAASTRFAAEVGFDAVELHLGHGYLLSQFLSPATNRRRDDYGGSPTARAKLPLEVVDAALNASGGRLAVLCKLNLADGFPGGVEPTEVAALARSLAAAGVHGLVPSVGSTSRSPFFLLRGEVPLRRMVEVERSALQKVALRVLGSWILRRYPFEENFLMGLARGLREAVELPVGLLGGIVSHDGVERAMQSGFDFLVLGRALLADPDFVNRLRSGELVRSRCTACNECIAEMDEGGVRCVLDGPRRSADLGHADGDRRG